MDSSFPGGWRRWFHARDTIASGGDSTEPKAILLVDDEPNVRLMYRTSLAEFGYRFDEAGSAEIALDHLRKHHYEAAILDLRLPGMDGLDLLEKMHDEGIETPAALVTAHGDGPNAVRAMELGAIDFIPKPPTPEQLREVVQDILERHSKNPLKGHKDFDYYLRTAKRALNLRDFTAASKALIKALDLDPRSRQAINLVGVLIEMRQEHACNGKPAIEWPPANPD